MKKPDDSRLTPAQYAKVRAEAERALKEAGALGRFPTPVADIMAVAKVEEVEDDVLNEGFVAKLRREVGELGGSLRRALKKVIGLFDARSGLVFIDRSLYVVKQTFVRLHEAGHGFMKWQRDLYAVVEDSEHEIDSGLADQFDREANVFASEVMFQLNGFSDEAEGFDFAIGVPMKLSKTYGSSIYAAVRRYVTHNWRACTVIVLDMPELIEGDGFRANVRRTCASTEFANMFGELQLPEFITPDHKLGHMVPVGGKRMTGRRSINLVDRNGDKQKCFAEAFTQSHQVFILIHATKTLVPTKVILLPAA